MVHGLGEGLPGDVLGGQQVVGGAHRQVRLAAEGVLGDGLGWRWRALFIVQKAAGGSRRRQGGAGARPTLCIMATKRLSPEALLQILTSKSW